MADQADELRKMMAGQAVKHTPEPWHVRTEWNGRRLIAIAGELPENDFEIARLHGFPHPAANARRIVACVNACRGISTVDLEKYSEITKYVADVPTMMKQAGQELSEITRERDEARMKIETLEATIKEMSAIAGLIKVALNEIASAMD